MLAALQYGSAAIPHTECLGKRRNLNTSRTGETVSDRARPGRRPVSSNPVPLHDAGPRRGGGNVRLNVRLRTSTSTAACPRRLTKPDMEHPRQAIRPASRGQPPTPRGKDQELLAGWPSTTLGLPERHNLYVPPSSTLLIKTIVTIEGVARSLNPDLNVVAAAVPIVLRAMSRRWLTWRFWRERALVGS